MNRSLGSGTSPAHLPVPSDSDLAISESLRERVVDRIRANGGFLGFDEYMEAALYEPKAGYYTSGLNKFGVDGDFVTAPELGSIFGRCLARQCDEILARVGGDIVEFGAGSGRLAAQLLTHADQLPENYLVVEPSAELKERQRRTIEAECPEQLSRVRWLDRLPDSISGVVIANEVLDAIPVVRFVRTGSTIQEVGVGESDGELVYKRSADSPKVARLSRHVAWRTLAEGYTSEYGERAEAWTRSVSASIGNGVLLAIDYGYAASEYYHPMRSAGTLRCHYRQRAHDDPLRWPGLQDIGAHVNFSAIAAAGAEADADLLGYASLANFLMSLGIGDLALAPDALSIPERVRQSNEIQRLLDPSMMGESFRVLALGRGYPHALLGYRQRDQRHQLG